MVLERIASQAVLDRFLSFSIRYYSYMIDEYFDEYCRLDPVHATLVGRSGFDLELTDYSPQGWKARAALLGDTLASTSDAVHRERLAAELAYLESGLASSLNVVAAPPMLIRTCLEQTPAAALPARLRAVPAALSGYLRTLVEDGPGLTSRRQAEMVLGAVRSWAAGPYLTDLGGTEAGSVAAAGFASFADGLERDVLPSCRSEDGVGSQAYRVAARYLLGSDVDIAELRDWLTDRLGELGAEIVSVAGTDVREVCASLDETARVEAGEPLRAWLQDALERSFDLAGRVLDVPEPLRRIEAVVPAAREVGPIRYLPPAADLSRPGRVTWSLAEDSTPVWGQLTMVHHEGVPGHHLQVGAAVLDERLPLWQRHTTVYGHAEGWAVYAEGLMADLGALDDPPARLGYLLGLRANVAVALADIGLHTEGWPLDRAVTLLREHTTLPEGMLYFSALRTAAWPGQALTYAYGERAWLDLRATAERLQGNGFDPRRFHARMLGVGPCGLSVLAELAGQPSFWTT